MWLFKKCKHKNTQTVTNIFGDMCNHFKGRRYVNCIDCGKELLVPDLDLKSKTSNQFYSELFYLKSHNGIKGVSDGDNTFNQLYRQITILFAALCNTNKENSCKSWVTSNNNFKSSHFIAGIKIDGQWYSYYFDKRDWELFQVEWTPTFPEATLLDNDNMEEFMLKFVTPEREIILGDVYENIYRHIVVEKVFGKYRLRACHPDGFEYYVVDENWFNSAKYIETIELQ